MVGIQVISKNSLKNVEMIGVPVPVYMWPGKITVFRQFEFVNKNKFHGNEKM